MRLSKYFLGAAVFILVFALASCAMEPYEYVDTIDEIPQGPGLFTGEDGEAVLYQRPKEKKEPEESKE